MFRELHRLMSALDPGSHGFGVAAQPLSILNRPWRALYRRVGVAYNIVVNVARGQSLRLTNQVFVMPKLGDSGESYPF